MTRTVSAIALTAAVSALLTFAPAHDARSDATDPDVIARQDVMKTIGAQTKILGDMAKGDVAFDAAAAQAAATTMAEAAANIPTVFETEADDAESKALAVIWANWDDFTTKGEALETAATNAATSITDAASLGPAMGQIGGTCRACHQDYRESN